MKERIEKVAKFYLLATTLKYKIRSGWNETHWNISNARIESIAEHIYGTCILAIGFDSEFNLELDINKVIKMLVLHELEEILIGDITPFDNIPPKIKERMGCEAVKRVLKGLIKEEEYCLLLQEFDKKETKEAIFAFHCDKLDADTWSKVYQDKGAHHSLDDQENNVVFKSKKVQQMVADGAKTPFDIWYEYDKNLYADDERFMAFLDYLKEINTFELLNKTIEEENFMTLEKLRQKPNGILAERYINSCYEEKEFKDYYWLVKDKDGKYYIGFSPDTGSYCANYVSEEDMVDLLNDTTYSNNRADLIYISSPELSCWMD